MRDTKTKSVKHVRNVTIELPIQNDYPIFSDFLDEIQRQFDAEKNIKNHLYAFITGKGLLKDLKEYESSHNMTDSKGHANAITLLHTNLPESKN